MWGIVTLALHEPDFSWRVRWAALVATFLVTRRTGEVLDLELGEVTVRPDGGVHVQVRFHKGAERRSRLQRLNFDVLPARVGHYDPPVVCRRRRLADLHAARVPPSWLLFASPGMRREPTSDDMTSWLQAALQRLGISASPGVKWCGYSARGGGATALYLCGLSPPGVAQLLGHKGNDTRTTLAHYIDLLAPRSAEAWWLCGRYIP